ncbi:aspartate/glutamate racemase family protein [Mechercharimyces sp. CAU 1602]|uniref:aspartate/glutamate racemase family protein n=1 Tax=Mechercharimyces sp. CAU 1602 TaxID=2973933 RepID=UPI002161B339|nr:aspartate/glutamate racemase family protein [Mechercharimyces sp. CAU 1602]MCS1351271.1 aspartate/glutamate racemase family protein [Mechercharimyces sp. CAU 1602]
MRTIGIIGGMSWESTATYYRLLNEGVRKRLGGLHSAKILLHSCDFAEIEAWQRAGSWEEAGTALASTAKTLERAGADFILLATNTMHLVADTIQSNVHIPFLHIVDAIGEHLQQQGIQKALLLATRFSMRHPFYRERLQQRYGISLLTPTAVEQELIHRIIYDELCVGNIRSSSRQKYHEVIRNYKDQVESIILGCTEIGLLLSQSKVMGLPTIDSTRIHVDTALRWAMNESWTTVNRW